MEGHEGMETNGCQTLISPPCLEEFIKKVCLWCQGSSFKGIQLGIFIQ